MYTLPAARMMCEVFNQHHRPGDAVILIDDMGNPIVTRLKFEASMSAGGYPVVGVEDKAAVYLLSRVVPINSERMNFVSVMGEA